MEKLVKHACKFITEVEIFRETPYKNEDGVWSIGYGSLTYQNGNIVQEWGEPVSELLGRSLLTEYLKTKALPELEEKIPSWSIMNEGQKIVCLSFAHGMGYRFYDNIGFERISSALKTKQNWWDVPDSLLFHTMPGTPFEEYLIKRRNSEVKLWKESTECDITK
jgi:GH24 family phage-related lysozyme (muramidase)